MKKQKLNRKSGFTLFELLFCIVVLVIVVVALISLVTWARKTTLDKMVAGGSISGPTVDMIYTVTAVDSNAGAVVVIPHDRYYTSYTLHRVLLRVDEKVRIVGVDFTRSLDGVDHLMVPSTNYHLKGWIEASPE